MLILGIILGALICFLALSASDNVFDKIITYREQTRKIVSDYYDLAEDFFVHKLLKL